MSNSNEKALYFTSIIIAVMACIASLGGLFLEGLYKDNALVTSAWQGNDIITLIIVVPVMLVSAFKIRVGSKAARLFWLGSLWYMVYNYMFYTFGAAFNPFFLLYVGIFTFSTYTLIFALIRTDAKELSREFRSKTPVRWISAFMIFFAFMLGIMWIAFSLSYLFTGEVHQSIKQTEHPTAVVFAVDLSLLIPSLLLGGSYLRKRHPWGFVLSTVVLIKAAAYGLALIVMTAVSYIKTNTIDPFIILWIILTLGCVVSMLLLLVNMNKVKIVHSSQDSSLSR